MGWVSVHDAIIRDCCKQLGCVRDAETNGYCSGHDPSRNDFWGHQWPVDTKGESGAVATQAEVTELIGHIRKAGYKVTKSGNAKHWKVLSPRGAVVVDDNGPLIISTTPSEHRFREMTVKRLMAAGVLKADPYKPTTSNPQEKTAGKNGDQAKQRKGKEWASERMRSPEMQAAKIAAVKAKSAKMKERTAKLRGRFEPIVVKLGGWATHSRGSGLTTNELGAVIYAWAKNRGRMELPQNLTRGGFVTADSLRSPAQTFKTRGGTLGDKWLPLFEVFIDDLERDAGTPPKPEKAAERYMELVREMKGISPGPASPRPLPPITEKPVEPPPPKPEPVPGLRVEGPGGEVKIIPLDPQKAFEMAVAKAETGATDVSSGAMIGPRYDPDTYIDAPELALDALYEMAMRTPPGATDARERHLKLARRIAELELNQRRGGTT